ncbi:MAG TPA: diguanylate cyclase [Candidatus Acidoferrum sp.]|nr:diguanylate cyclase [Candidatus Acidoferrum sp.]
MNRPTLHPVAAATRARDQELAAELRRIEKRDWWVWGYSIFVMLLLTFGIISFTLPALYQGAETVFRIRLTEAVYGLIALVLLFNIYTVYQQILIKRLRRQLAEKQGHSDILRNLAMIDPLTGLYNRRFAEHRLAAEVARSERKGHPLTLLTLDLNNFKQINDTYGHPAGDQVLQEFAAHLNKVIRGADLAVRLGGDEFLVLLPECTLEQLQLVLGRLGSMEVDWHGQKIPVTFSAGWKQYELGDQPGEMLARADQDLYARKRAGKNSGQTEESSKQRPAPLHVLVDVTCAHCHKKNSVAVDAHSQAGDAGPHEVQCAHCKETWKPALSGPILAGPFPK